MQGRQRLGSMAVTKRGQLSETWNNVINIYMEVYTRDVFRPQKPKIIA